MGISRCSCLYAPSPPMRRIVPDPNCPAHFPAAATAFAGRWRMWVQEVIAQEVGRIRRIPESRDHDG